SIPTCNTLRGHVGEITGAVHTDLHDRNNREREKDSNRRRRRRESLTSTWSTSAADNWRRELITCFVIQFLIRIGSGRFDVLLLNGLYTFLAVAIRTDIVLFSSIFLFLT
ncbi:hypothetical protein ALC62_01614, partial [Cyphomyrmex costatus]